MAPFDRATSGTSESDWASCSWLHDAVEIDGPAPSRLTVLAAHPDDETLGAGGLIARTSQRGGDAHLIIASDGAASHPASPTCTPQEMALRRRDEARRAVATLSPHATVDFLDLPDGKLADHPADLDAALRSACPGGTQLAAPWAFDRHPDHAACAHAARRLIQQSERVDLIEFPIWAWHWGRPGEQFVTLDIQATTILRLALTDAQLVLKHRAIQHYASQIEPLSDAPGDEVVLDPETLRHFRRDTEYFLQIEPKP